MSSRNIVVIITNFNNSSLSLNFYKSALLLKQTGNYFVSHFIIVDNNSTAAEKSILESSEIEEGIILIKLFSKENVGYFKGLNIGLDFLISNGISFHSVIIGNNDMAFDENFLSCYEEISDCVRDFPVICPNLVDLDGVRQNPHLLHELSKFREFMHTVYYSNYFLSKIITFAVKVLNKKRIIPQNFDNTTMEEGYGACYILTPLFFEYYSKLFAPFFLMFEESALSFQLKNIGYKPFYCSRVTIKHFEHSTFKKFGNKFSWKVGRDSFNIKNNMPELFRYFLKYEN